MAARRFDSRQQNLVLSRDDARCDFEIFLGDIDRVEMECGVEREPVDLVAYDFAVCEIWRRSIWNFFRLEHEHLNNCGEFRAVRDISIAPIKDDDVVKLERMMDRSAGVRNRSKKADKK